MSVLYDLEWRLADDTPVGSANGVTTVDYYDLSGLTEYTTYEWRIRADDAEEKSDWSAWAAFSTGILIAVPVVNIVFSALIPAVSLGASVLAPAVGITLDAPLPAINTGALVLIGSSTNITVGTGTPTIATGTSLSVPATDITLSAPLPMIIVGTSLSVPATDITLSAPLPIIITGVSFAVPSVHIIMAAPNVRFVGMMPDGVDRPRVVSDTPRYQVSHAA